MHGIYLHVHVFEVDVLRVLVATDTIEPYSQ
jgi:hypothetical protein